MKEKIMEQIVAAMNWRYATQVFDGKKTVSREELDTVLEAGRLSASSYGTEPWKFIVVEKPEVRTALRAAAYGQPKVTDADYLIVIARRTDARSHITQELLERTARIRKMEISALDGLKNALEGVIARNDDSGLDAWIRAQTYIPLGAMMLAASLVGVDNGPMEGFDPVKVNEILGLSAKNLTATTMLALGHRGDDQAAGRTKVRRPAAEVIEFV